MSFTKRKIAVKLQLGKGTFGDSGSDTIDLAGLRVSATIDIVGGETFASCAFKVYGLSLDAMNKLTLLGKRLPEGRQNTLTLSAGDEKKGMAVAFVGHITECWADLRGQPANALVGVAQAGILDALKPVPPTSYNGSVDAATVVKGIAAQMVRPGTTDAKGANATGYDFENSGVNVQLRDTYLAGTLVDQLRAVAREGDFNCIIDGTTVAIWPKGGARGGARPLISPATGLVGYPVYTENGLEVTTIYNPNVIYGSLIRVESELTPAVGNWYPYQITHDLESETPGGKWFTRISCSILGSETSVGG